MPSDIVVRVQSQDQGWQTVGVDRYRGVTPEGLRCSADEWGPDGCSFVLKRKPGAIFPDLLSPTPCEIDIAGVTCWDGWIKEAPEQDGEQFQAGVVGAGWQYHLDEDTNERMWVHTRLPDWADWRSNINADLASFLSVCQVSVGQGMISVTYPQGVAAAGSGGVYLDAGAGQTIARVVIDWSIAAGAANRAWSLERSTDGVTWTTDGGAAIYNGIAASSGTLARTLGVASRYIRIRHDANTHTPAADEWLKITRALCFRSTAYESGNASILKTSDLVKDVLPWAPLLSQDTSQIASTTFNWPEAAPFDEKTPREIIEAFTAAEQMQARLRIGRALQYRALPTTPLFEIGEWSGADFKDTAAGSAQDVYNKVKIRGIGPDGLRLTVTRTQTGTVHDRFGRVHSKVIPVSMGLITALGNQLGDTFLATHKTMPFKGDFTAKPGGVRRIEGGTIHPGHLLVHTGELLRLSHRIDPDSGAWGRDGRIVRVEFDHEAGDEAQTSLDNTRGSFEALLVRLGAAVGGS